MLSPNQYFLISLPVSSLPFLDGSSYFVLDFGSSLFLFWVKLWVIRAYPLFGVHWVPRVCHGVDWPENAEQLRQPYSRSVFCLFSWGPVHCPFIALLLDNTAMNRYSV